jgi:hypothetical protein
VFCRVVFQYDLANIVYCSSFMLMLLSENA